MRGCPLCGQRRGRLQRCRDRRAAGACVHGHVLGDVLATTGAGGPEALSLQRKAISDKKPSDEAVSVVEQICGKYANVEWQDGRLGDAMEPLLFSLKYLQVGRTPPDIVGKDVNGVEIKLSDFRGKIVVLDFWVDWCPYCREMYPLKRQLAKRAKDQPIAVVGVNCDEPLRLRQLLDDGTITRKNMTDGPRGPIQQIWQITGYPTVFVLDEEGVIRYRDVRGLALEEAVDTLLKKTARSGGAKPSSEGGKSPADRAETGPTSAQPAAVANSRVEEMRQWTRRDGRTARMRFLKLDGTTASFLTAAGKTYTLSIDALCDADQTWIHDHAK